MSSKRMTLIGKERHKLGKRRPVVAVAAVVARVLAEVLLIIP